MHKYSARIVWATKAGTYRATCAELEISVTGLTLTDAAALLDAAILVRIAEIRDVGAPLPKRRRR